MTPLSMGKIIQTSQEKCYRNKKNSDYPAAETAGRPGQFLSYLQLKDLWQRPQGVLIINISKIYSNRYQ